MACGRRGPQQTSCTLQSIAEAMPLKSSGRNGNHTGQDSKANGHGDEDSSNSDCDSSLCELIREALATGRLVLETTVYLSWLFYLADDEAEAEKRKVDCLDDMQFLEQQFSDLKEL